MPNKRKHDRKNATQWKRTAIEYVCCPICGRQCQLRAGIASHLRTCSSAVDYNQSEQTITHDNESMNGSFDTGMVNSIKISERVVDDIDDQAAVEEDDRSDHDNERHGPDYSYGLDEMDITEYGEYDDNHMEDYSHALDSGDNVGDTERETENTEKDNNIEHGDKDCLFRKYMKYKEEGLLHSTMLTKEMQHSIELLAILQNSNVSDAVYDKIVDWLWHCSEPELFMNMPKRDTMMGKLQNRYMMDDMYPENEECILPSIDLPIYVPVHSFVNSLFSLLTSTDLMRSEHLLFADKRNPAYVPPQDPNGNYRDVNTGDAYYRFHDGIKNKSDTVLVSLMIFADGMCIDKYG